MKHLQQRYLYTLAQCVLSLLVLMIKTAGRAYSKEVNAYFLFLKNISEVLARATSVKDGLEACKNGTDLYKIRYKGKVLKFKEYKRRYRLDLDDLAIYCYPTKGKAKGLALTSCSGEPNGKIYYFS